MVPPIVDFILLHWVTIKTILNRHARKANLIYIIPQLRLSHQVIIGCVKLIVKLTNQQSLLNT